jgi:hypothetical protein
MYLIQDKSSAAGMLVTMNYTGRSEKVQMNAEYIKSKQFIEHLSVINIMRNRIHPASNHSSMPELIFRKLFQLTTYMVCNKIIYSKTCLNRTLYIPETWTNGK